MLAVAAALKAVEVVRAAFQLPGHSMAAPARKDVRPVGVEARTLDEVAGRLRAGGSSEQQALSMLTADLLEHCGVNLNDVHVAGDNNSGKGKGSHGKGAGKGNRKGAGKGSGK